jgi:hypothetical protein
MKMGNTDITCHADLLERIAYLKSEKIRQEEGLKSSFRNLVPELSLSSFMMNGLARVRSNEKSILPRLVRILFDLVYPFLLNRMVGKRGKFKSFLCSLLGKLPALLLSFR